MERLELLESQRAEQTARGELAASEWAAERQGLEGKHRLALIGLESKDRECADLRKTVERLTTSVSEAQARAAESDDRARSAESRMWTELSARNEEISGLITANTQSELAMVTEMSELRQAVEARTQGSPREAAGTNPQDAGDTNGADGRCKDEGKGEVGPGWGRRAGAAGLGPPG